MRNLQWTILSQSIIVIYFHASSLTYLVRMILILIHKCPIVKIIMGLTQKLMELSWGDNFISIYSSTVVQLQSNQLL